MNERFEADLLAYARGELAPEETAWMEAYLAENPDVRKDTELLRLTFAALSFEAEQVQRDPDEGLAALREKFIRHHAARNKTESQAVDVSIPAGWWSRTKESWHRVKDRMALGMGATLDVRFSATATEAEIRALLQKSKGRIVNGPDSMASYAVKVPRKQQQEALEALRDSRIVYSANLRSPRDKK